MEKDEKDKLLAYAEVAQHMATSCQYAQNNDWQTAQTESNRAALYIDPHWTTLTKEVKDFQDFYASKISATTDTQKLSDYIQKLGEIKTQLNSHTAKTTTEMQGLVRTYTEAEQKLLALEPEAQFLGKSILIYKQITSLLKDAVTLLAKTHVDDSDLMQAETYIETAEVKLQTLADPDIQQLQARTIPDLKNYITQNTTNKLNNSVNEKTLRTAETLLNS